MKSVNPATNELIEEYELMSDQELEGILESAHNAQEEWRKTSYQRRASLLQSVAEHLEDRKAAFAKLMAREMGKPLAQGTSEIEKCAWVCNYYAENAGDFLQDQIMTSDANKSYVTFNSLGVIFAIMPWNFPFWQFFRFAAPALMAGNAAILKHSSSVTGCALAIEEVMHAAGIPDPLFRTVLADNEKAQWIIKHPGIAAVTLTGSVKAGKAVAATAGGELKKTVLELGGSDPYIVLGDADIELAAETCVNSRLINSGQSCIAAKRFIVVANIYDSFLEAITEKMKAKKTGNPFDESTDVGPMATKKLRDDLHQQVKKSIEAGAECILGGEISDQSSAFYPPTILTDIAEGMPAYNEELFGPVASVIKVENEQEAIYIANDTDFGLGAAIFSQDINHAEKIAATELQAGCCFINHLVKSDPRLPFGGIKHSGYGRELSHFGIKEFTNIKTVYRA